MSKVLGMIIVYGYLIQLHMGVLDYHYFSQHYVLYINFFFKNVVKNTIIIAFIFIIFH